jgi:hypothetical protein
VQTTIAAIYIKVSSPTVTEAEVSELLERLADNGCRLANKDNVTDVADGSDELENLKQWVGIRNFDIVCIRRAVNLEDRDAYLSFIHNLYSGNVALLGLRRN